MYWLIGHELLQEEFIIVSWHYVSAMDKERLSEHKKKKQPSGTVPYTVSMKYKLRLTLNKLLLNFLC